MASVKPVSTAHYFPPNPQKIGDNLLTVAIAQEFARDHSVVYYYGSPTVCGIIDRFDMERVVSCPVSSLDDSFALCAGTASVARADARSTTTQLLVRLSRAPVDVRY